jgi:hypothetical protein
MGIISKDSVIMKQFNNFKRIKLDDVKREAVEVNDKELVEINRQQMQGSRQSDGLLPKYSQISLSLKDFSDYRGIFPHFNLRDTGSFQDKMYGTVQGDNYIVSSRDSKTGSLVARLGQEIFEYDTSSLQQVQMLVTRDYVKLVHEKINA